MHDRRHTVFTLRSIVVLSVSAFVLGSLAGCAGGDGHPPRVPVEVEVTYNGAPVEGAHVTFAPVGESQPAFGTTGPNGRALLSTFGENDGALPGSYQVGVRETQIADPASMAPDDTGAIPVGDTAQRPTEFREELPGKFGSPSHSGLEAIVTEGAGKNTFQFELTD